MRLPGERYSIKKPNDIREVVVRNMFKQLVGSIVCSLACSLLHWLTVWRYVTQSKVSVLEDVLLLWSGRWELASVRRRWRHSEQAQHKQHEHNRSYHWIDVVVKRASGGKQLSQILLAKKINCTSSPHSMQGQAGNPTGNQAVMMCLPHGGGGGGSDSSKDSLFEGSNKFTNTSHIFI